MARPARPPALGAGVHGRAPWRRSCAGRRRRRPSAGRRPPRASWAAPASVQGTRSSSGRGRPTGTRVDSTRPTPSSCSATPIHIWPSGTAPTSASARTSPASKSAWRSKRYSGPSTSFALSAPVQWTRSNRHTGIRHLPLRLHSGDHTSRVGHRRVTPARGLWRRRCSYPGTPETSGRVPLQHGQLLVARRRLEPGLRPEDHGGAVGRRPRLPRRRCPRGWGHPSRRRTATPPASARESVSTAGPSPENTCTTGRRTAPNTNGSSSAWQEPRIPPNAGDSQSKR